MLFFHTYSYHICNENQFSMLSEHPLHFFLLFLPFGCEFEFLKSICRDLANVVGY